MALILPVLLFLVFGAITSGMTLDRHLSALQAVRCAGSMYARGADFSSLHNKNLLLMGAGGLGITATSGDGVIYLSAVVKAAPGTQNQNLLVLAERYVIGNSSFESSRIGTPSPSIVLPNGQVQDYENEPSARATLPAAFATIDLNQRIYVVELSYSMAGVGGWTGLFNMDRVYSRAFF
jgi:hypothetical protein